MESFKWGQHFETGFSEVDTQHRQLVRLINQLGKLITENEVNMGDVETLYEELADYAKYHFQEEEQLMITMNVDARHVISHIENHQAFLEELSSIYSGVNQHTLDQVNDFLKFLMHWLAYHILGQDQDMAKQMEAINSGVSPRNAYEQLQFERRNATAPLLDALNGLFKQVSVRNKKLKELNESLEEKVALRTEELTAANRYLKELSYTDVLTGLPNRRQAMSRLSALWDQSVENRTELVCIMIDVDHFKEVNDTFGHDVGDRLLIQLAKALKNTFRNDDLVSRPGGDEFLVICPNTDLEGGINIAELTRDTVSKLRIETDGETWQGSISLGVATRTAEMTHFEELIKEADKSAYVAKKAGKNCVKTTLL